MICTLTIDELTKIKEEAETEIASNASRILEDFKRKTGITYIDYVSLNSNYIESLGYGKETFITGATLGITL